MTRWTWVHVLAITAGLTAIAGCNSNPDKGNTQNSPETYSGKYPIKAVVTVGMVADIVRKVGGDKLEVQQIMGSGVDPHLYKPTRDDVAKIMAGDIIFYCGLMLEGRWLIRW